MRTLAAALVLTLAAGLAATAGEPEKKPAREKGKQDKQEVVTNEKLKEKYGEPAPAKPPGKQAGPAEKPGVKKPAAVMSDRERAERIAELKKEEDRLGRRIKSLKNPFLPRVPPTEEEAKAEAGKGADERVRMLEARLVLVQEERKKLEKQDKPAGRSR